MNRKSVIIIVIIVLCLITLSGAEDQPKRVMNFLAVMDLKCGAGIEKEQCAALTDVLIDEMVKMKKYTVIDRANRDKILSEAGFQQTGCVDNSCTIEMGRQLGVGKMVVGSVAKLEETYLVNLQLLNVETAAVENSARETCEKCKLDNLITTISNDARKLMGEAPASTPAPPPVAPIVTDAQKIVSAGICPAPQEGKAMIIFYMPYDGGSRYYTIYENGQKIAKTPRGTYFYYEVNPGPHTFKSNISLVHGDITVELQHGAIIFIETRHIYVGGAHFPGDALGMKVVETDVGIFAVKKCEYEAPKAGE